MKLFITLSIMLLIVFSGNASDTRYIKEIDSNTIVVPADIYNEDYSEDVNGIAYTKDSCIIFSEEYFIYENFLRLDFERQEVLVYDPSKNGGKITPIWKNKATGSKIAWWGIILTLILFGLSYLLFLNIIHYPHIPSKQSRYFEADVDPREPILIAFAVCFFLFSAFIYFTGTVAVITVAVIWVAFINLIAVLFTSLFENSYIYPILLCIGMLFVWYHYTPLFLVSAVLGLGCTHLMYWLYEKYFD